MNTAERLSELALDFQRRSTAKHRAAGLRGDAIIAEVRGHYRIVYRDGGVKVPRSYPGSFIGQTRVQAIRWLLEHRKAWLESVSRREEV